MYGMDSTSISWLGFGAVVMVGGVIMYLVSLFSMKETSFEDVLEEERKRKAEEDKERSLHNKQKREQYKKKFDQKKKKTSAIGNGKVERAEGANAAGDNQAKHDADHAEPAPVEPKKQQPKAKSAKKQEALAQPKPKDSPKPSHPILKLKDEKSEEEDKPVKTAAEAKAEMQKGDASRVRTVSFSEDVQDKQKNEGEQEKSKKKKKKEIEVENEIVGQLKDTSLSERDVQNILTMIKQKYGIDVGGGTKIKDLQQLLDNARKQLTQQETNLKNYVSRCMGAEGKTVQLQQDILVEKTKVTSLEKAVEDAETKRKAEVSSLKSQHAAEMKQVQEKIEIAKDYEKLCKNVASLKTENQLLRSEVEKNAAVMSEKSRLSADLKLANTQLQEAQKKCTDLEKKLQNASKTSENLQQKQGDQEKQYIHKLQEQANRFLQMEQSHKALNSELKEVKSLLEATQSDSAKLLNQVNSLNEDVEAKTASQLALEQRLEESAKKIAERDSKIKSLKKETSDLSAQVKNFEHQIAQLKSEAAIKVEQERKSKCAADVTATKETQMKELQSSLEKTEKEKSVLKVEVDRLKKKNNDLRERSWNVMDNLSRLQKELPEKVYSAKAEGETRCANLQSFIKQSLSNAFSTISIKEENFEVWVAEFMKQALESSQTVQSTQDSSSELDQAKSEVQKLHDKLAKSSEETSKLKSALKNLEASVENAKKENASFKTSASEHEKQLSNAVNECEKYKSVLTTTEEVLRKLQSSVEVEEGMWRKKVNDAQCEASTAKKDTENLQHAITTLKSEKSSLESELRESKEFKKKLEEMTSEVSELKSQLETAKAAVTDSLQETDEIELNSEHEGSDLEQQCESTAESNHSDSPVQVQYSDTGVETVVVVEQHPDVDGFLVIEQHDFEEERLEKEKSLTKNLGQAATKLQGALKQSQQQLKEEKDKNAELEQKLANGDTDQVVSENAATQQESTDPVTGDGTSV